MKIREYLGLSKHRQRQISRTLQVLLLGMVVYGAISRNAGIAVNALVGLLATFLPALLKDDHDITMDPALVLWLSTAVFLHAFGVLGPYSLWWWDHMTHALSSSVVAAAGYASFRAFELHSEDLHFPNRLFAVFILIFVMAFGVIWELIEFGIGIGSSALGMKAILAQHGLEDTMKDLMFDLLGGLIVALFGEAYLSGLIDQTVSYLEEKRDAALEAAQLEALRDHATVSR